MKLLYHLYRLSIQGYIIYYNGCKYPMDYSKNINI